MHNLIGTTMDILAGLIEAYRSAWNYWNSRDSKVTLILNSTLGPEYVSFDVDILYKQRFKELYLPCPATKRYVRVDSSVSSHQLLTLTVL